MGGASSSLLPETRRFLADVKAGRCPDVEAALHAHPTLVKRATVLRGESAVLIAAAQGYSDMLESMLQQANELGAVLEATSGMRRAPRTQAEFVRSVINAGNDRSQTPLMLAADGGHLRCVELLLSQGADPWAVDKLGGRAALHYAALAGVPAIAEKLIAAAGDSGEVHFPNQANTRYVNLRTMCGLSPLHKACLAGHAAMVDVLVKHGASITAVTMYECTAGHVRVGSTPLHTAAFMGQTPAAKALLKAYMEGWGRSPATPDLRLMLDSSGCVPLQVALRRRRRGGAGGEGEQFEELLRILNPRTPLVTVFTPGELELVGPPSLRLLASSALRAHLEASLAAVEALHGRRSCATAGPKTERRAAASPPFDVHALTCMHIEQQGVALARSSAQAAPSAAAAADSARTSSGGGALVASPGGQGPAASDCGAPGGKRDAAAAAKGCPPGEAGPACTTPGRLAAGDAEVAAASCSEEAAGGGSAGCTCEACGLQPARSQPDAARLLIGGWGGGGASDGACVDDDDATCGVCLDEVALVRLQPCEHRLCSGCCRSLFKLDYANVVLCPFCRTAVGGYASACC